MTEMKQRTLISTSLKIVLTLFLEDMKLIGQLSTFFLSSLFSDHELFSISHGDQFCLFVCFKERLKNSLS